MQDILKEALPSCGVVTAEELHESETMDFLITMTIGERKSLNPGGWQ